jgi:hypothetical protein
MRGSVLNAKRFIRWWIPMITRPVDTVEGLWKRMTKTVTQIHITWGIDQRAVNRFLEVIPKRVISITPIMQEIEDRSKIQCLLIIYETEVEE